MKITKEQIREYASKTSSEWWQVAMTHFNSFPEKEREKYNQFIGFNDFSDILMNELIRALEMVVIEGKLVYEEGNLCYPPCSKENETDVHTYDNYVEDNNV